MSSQDKGSDGQPRGLFANIGMGQLMPDGTREPCIITLGDDFAHVGRFCSAERPDYTAADVVRHLLG